MLKIEPPNAYYLQLQMVYIEIKRNSTHQLNVCWDKKRRCLSQQIGAAGEDICEKHLRCPNCSNRSWQNMNRTHMNYPAIDLQCLVCNAGLQVKTSSRTACVSGSNYILRISSEAETYRFIKSPKLFYIVRLEYDEKTYELLRRIVSPSLRLRNLIGSRVIFSSTRAKTVVYI